MLKVPGLKGRNGSLEIPHRIKQWTTRRANVGPLAKLLWKINPSVPSAPYSPSFITAEGKHPRSSRGSDKVIVVHGELLPSVHQK
jgi:hypothetical protein